MVTRNFLYGFAEEGLAANPDVTYSIRYLHKSVYSLTQETRRVKR
jgi:hypothetical protein